MSAFSNVALIDTSEGLVLIDIVHSEPTGFIVVASRQGDRDGNDLDVRDLNRCISFFGPKSQFGNGSTSVAACGFASLAGQYTSFAPSNVASGAAASPEENPYLAGSLSDSS